MNYLKLIFLVLVFFCTKFSIGQVELEWIYTYNHIGWYDYARDFTVDNFGNIYITGESTGSNNPTTDYDFATIKLNNSGNQIWINRLDIATNDGGKAITTDNSGNIYVTGQAGMNVITIKYSAHGEELWRSTSFNRNPADIETDSLGNIFITGDKPNGVIFLVKFDENGNVIWDQEFDYPLFMSATVRKLTINNGKIFIVGTAYNDSTYFDGFLLAYDSDGSLLWNIIFNGSSNGFDGFNSITFDSQKSVLVTGFVEDSLGNGKMLTSKYSTDGKLIWHKTFDYNDHYDVANIVLTDSNDNVYVGGYVEYVVPPVGYSKFALIKYDKSGKFLWFRALAPDTLDSSKIEYMSLDSEANIYCVGRYNDLGFYIIQIAKFSSQGNLLYDFRYPTDNKLAQPSGLIVQDIDEFLVCGYLYGNVTPPDYLILKFSIPTSVNGEQISSSGFNLYQNFPNPFNPTTKIKFTVAESPLLGGDGRGGLVTLKVYDVLGNEVATLVNEEKPAGSYEVEFSALGGPASGIRYPASGIYFYQLKAGSFVQTKKMILLR